MKDVRLENKFDYCRTIAKYICKLELDRRNRSNRGFRIIYIIFLKLFDRCKRLINITRMMINRKRNSNFADIKM